MEKKLHTRKRMIKIVCVWYIKTDSIVIFFQGSIFFMGAMVHVVLRFIVMDSKW